MGRHTTGRITISETVGGYALSAEPVGRGYYALIGSATQRDPHPRHGGGIDAATAEANATLWAAAPELLEALRGCAAVLDCAADDLEGLDKPRAAIACRTRADAARAAIAKAGGDHG